MYEDIQIHMSEFYKYSKTKYENEERKCEGVQGPPQGNAF